MEQQKYDGTHKNNSIALVVPCDVSPLDEASVRMRDRKTARNFIPNKPDKYAVRFYSVVGYRHAYLSSIVDTISGNKTRITGGDDFTRVQRNMLTPFNNLLSQILQL